MRACHKKAVVADFGDTSAFFAAEVDGDGFTDGVAAANLKARFRRIVVIDLRLATDHSV